MLIGLPACSYIVVGRLFCLLVAVVFVPFVLVVSLVTLEVGVSSLE